MSDKYQKLDILKVIDLHSIKASKSEYDRSVSISAVSKVRELVLNLVEDSEEMDKKTLIETIELMKVNYNDPDGKYTNGKSIIGSLLDDLRFLAKKEI